MFTALFVLFALMAAAPVSAQVYLGAELGPGALLKVEEAKINREDEDAFARVFVLENSTADVYSVFETTTPEKTVAAYLRQGIYRQELLILFAIARIANIPFKTLAKKRSRGVTLQQLAGENKADLLELFRASESLKYALEEKAALLGLSGGVFNACAGAVSKRCVPQTADPPSAPDAGTEVSTAAAHENEKK